MNSFHFSHKNKHNQVDYVYIRAAGKEAKSKHNILNAKKPTDRVVSGHSTEAKYRVQG